VKGRKRRSKEETKISKKQIETKSKKLTPMRFLAIVILTTMGCLGFFAVIIFTLPFTMSMTTSFILGVVFIAVVVLLWEVLDRVRRLQT